MSNTNSKETNMKDALKTYFKGVKSEWGRITWPQRPQIIAETIIVLIVVTIITTAVYIIDIGFKGLFQLLHLT